MFVKLVDTENRPHHVALSRVVEVVPAPHDDEDGDGIALVYVEGKATPIRMRAQRQIRAAEDESQAKASRPAVVLPSPEPALDVSQAIQAVQIEYLEACAVIDARAKLAEAKRQHARGRGVVG